MVDDDIWLRWCRYKWRLKKSAFGYYVVRTKSINGKCCTLRLSREIMNCPKGKEVHHKNGDTLNYLRSNLEIKTPSEHSKESNLRRWHPEEAKDDIPF